MSVYFLVGGSGAGKTTIGKLLQTKRTTEVNDSDGVVTSRFKISIKFTFNFLSPEQFHYWEFMVINGLYMVAFTSTGGGFVLLSQGRVRFKETSTVTIEKVNQKQTNLEPHRALKPVVLTLKYLKQRSIFYRMVSFLWVRGEVGSCLYRVYNNIVKRSHHSLIYLE
jgi:shikimate kinase